MSVEQALEELKKYAQDFTKVGDAKQAIQNNKEDFLHKWTKVMQYYNYIMKKTENMSEDWFQAIDILSDIISDNSSLEEWVIMIINPNGKKQEKQQNQEIIDPAEITGPIESLVSEVQHMYNWDPEHIEDIEWELQKYQGLLIANKSLFSPNVYQSLMDDINASLNKINNFKKMINSETMEGIKRM